MAQGPLASLHLMMTRVVRRCAQIHPSPRVRRLLRDHIRKLCVDRELTVATSAGFTMCVSPRDYISHTIYFFGQYDPQMTSFLQAFLRPGLTAFDVGAERGWFTLLMARSVGPTGYVHGFEAFPPTAEKIRANVARNNMHWVRINEVAVTDVSGTVRFQPPGDTIVNNVPFLRCCGGIGHVAGSAGPGTIEVPAITLDEYVSTIPLRSLDVIKIDIEGAELNALMGARGVLERYRPVLLTEYNRAALRRSGRDWRELDRLLDACGYDRFLFDGTYRILDLDEFTSMPDEMAVLNVYAFPRRRVR